MFRTIHTADKMTPRPHSRCPRSVPARSIPGVARSLLLVVASATLIGTSLHAFAQSQDSRPQTQAAPTTQSDVDPADAVLDRLLDQPATGPAQQREKTLDPDQYAGGLNAATGSGPGVVAPDMQPRRLMREGTFVIDRLGRVRETEVGDLEFFFTADGTGPAAAGDPPMVLVPNLNLMAVESALRTDPQRQFRITGRVTEYRGRNYLILEKVVVVN